MEKTKHTKHAGLVILFLLMIGHQAFPQGDSLKVKNLKLSAAYMGAGFGIDMPGVGGVISGTLLLSNNWGASIRYNPNSLEAKYLPSDYVDMVLFVPFITNGIPADNVKALSFHLVKEFSTRTELVRFGIELGPSFIKYEEARFTPVEYWFPFMGSNYDVNHISKNCFGLSIRCKAEIPLTRFLGVEAAPYAVINRLRNVIGIDFAVTLGLLR